MRKILAILMIAMLTVAIPLALVNPVQALHEADVYWVGSDEVGGERVDGVKIDNVTFASPGSLEGGFNATFAVYNNPTPISDDSITNVRVVLKRDEGSVLFHFKAGYVYKQEENTTNLERVENWVSDPTEFDTANGWPGTIIFEATPEGSEETALEPGMKYYFTLEFSEGPETCKYEDALSVYTEDPGYIYYAEPGSGSGTPETELSRELDIVIDNEIPMVDVGVEPAPVDGNVTGRLLPCGRSYFDITGSAYDQLAHDTGLQKYEVWMDGTLEENDTIGSAPEEYNETAPWNLDEIMIEDHDEGSVNVTLVVWDNVGNRNSDTIIFDYVWPEKPLQVDPAEGYAALDTTVVDEASGLVDSAPYTSDQKTLGTEVQVTGMEYGANTTVDVYLTVPTYHDYNATYGSYDLLVAETTTDADGGFSTSFIIPEAPAGKYNLSAVSTTMECAVELEILPEIVLNPNEVVGPAMVDVKATGFTAESNTSWFILLPDALQGVNLQIDRQWYIDGNGTLVNGLNEATECTEQTIDTTLNWPFMEPGTYDVEIKHMNGDYWDRTTGWIRKPCFFWSNTITVTETLSKLVDIEDDTATIRQGVEEIQVSLDDLDATLNSIEDGVATIETCTGQIAADIDKLNATLVSVEGRMATLETTLGDMDVVLGDIAARIVDIEDGVATIETDVGTLTGTVESIEGDIATIHTDVGTLKTDVSGIQDDVSGVAGLSTPLWIAVALSLIAAIAAIAAVVIINSKLA